VRRRGPWWREPWPQAGALLAVRLLVALGTLGAIGLPLLLLWKLAG
jgi:hypothetical protein